MKRENLEPIVHPFVESPTNALDVGYLDDALSDKSGVITAETTPRHLAHQRPDEVFGEWELYLKEGWTLQQRIAAWTKGIGTLATVATIAGAAISVSGINDLKKRRYVSGAVKIVIGRGFDILDGELAKRAKVTSKMGAAEDASVDKGLVLYGSKVMASLGILSKPYAAATVAEHAAITVENTLIERAGGKPNPSKSGKRGMFGFWTGTVARVGQKICEQNPRTRKFAPVLGAVAVATELITTGLTIDALQGYDKQRAQVTNSPTGMQALKSLALQKSRQET